MAYGRAALVAALLCTAVQLVQAAPHFANMMFNFQEGEGFTITWTNAVGPVTLQVVSGDKVVLTIDSNDSGEQYTWTPEGLPSGTYALAISDSTGEARSVEWEYKSSVVATSATGTAVTPATASSPLPPATSIGDPSDSTSTSNKPAQTTATAAATATGTTSSSPSSEPSTQPSTDTTPLSSSGTSGSLQSPSPTASGETGSGGQGGSPAADANGSASGGGGSSSSSSSDSAGLSTGAKIGIGVGAGVGGLVVLGALALWIYRRGKAAGQKGTVGAPGLGENGIAELGAPEHKPRPELGGAPVSEMYAAYGEVPELSDAQHEEYARKLTAVELSAVPTGYSNGVPVEKG